MSDKLITRTASPRPTTANEEERTIEMVVASEADVGDGVVLSMATLPDFGPGPVPVLLDHSNTTSAMAGRLESLRIERRQLIGLARFVDAPAADEGWALARSGVAVSVGAAVDPAHLQPQARGPDLATRWRLREVSLTPIGADDRAVTRSLNPTTMTDPITTTDHQQEHEDRPAHPYELPVRRAASAAGLSEGAVDDLLARDYPNKTEAMVALVRAVRQETERNAPVHAGHPARTASAFASPREEAPGPLQLAVERCLRGEGAGERPLVEVLRASGYSGRSGGDVLKNALTGSRPENWLKRSLSTSDLPQLLLETGDRRLQERYQEAPRGVLQVARERPLADFKGAGIVDVGLVGQAVKILEGGEINHTSINESATKYKPVRYGVGLKFTFESMANDDLNGLADAIEEIRATIPEAQATELVSLLSAGASNNGALAPDGLQLFATAHANSVTGSMNITGLEDAVKALRKQKTVGGRMLNLAPGYILAGPELESSATQLLSASWTATVPENANPWKNLQLLIEPGITDQTWYLVASGPRRPLELGTVAGMPRMLSEPEFDTSAMKYKIEGAFGVAVADHRVIVRVKAA